MNKIIINSNAVKYNKYSKYSNCNKILNIVYNSTVEAYQQNKSLFHKESQQF